MGSAELLGPGAAWALMTLLSASDGGDGGTTAPTVAREMLQGHAGWDGVVEDEVNFTLY